MSDTATATAQDETQQESGGATQPQFTLQFGPNGIVPSKAIIHNDETFAVQWNAVNTGPDDSPAFTDLLVITSIPEGCPGSDDQDHPVVYNSEKDGDNPQDFLEGPIKAGESGSLMQTTVGPFATGGYRLTVTLGKDVANVSTFNCIDIGDA